MVVKGVVWLRGVEEEACEGGNHGLTAALGALNTFDTFHPLAGLLNQSS